MSGPAPSHGPIARALWAGALAGIVVGLGDAIVSWGRLTQFLPGAGGKLRAGLYAAGLYAAVTAVISALIAAILVGLYRWTAFGRLVRHGAAEHDRARARDPRDALVGTSLALVAAPVLAAGLYAAWRIGLHVVRTRNHDALETVVIMALTLAALVATAVVAVFAGKLVELALRELPPAIVRPLSHRLAPFAVLGAILAVATLVAAIVTRKLLAQLPLRPWIAGLVLVAVAIVLHRVGARIIPRHPAFRPAAVAVPLLVAFACGASDAARKGAAAHTGLAGPLARTLQRIADLDRDGYSPLLGGGDCDDWDGEVYPGAFDIPDDGVDQNCLNGDLKLLRDPADARFAEVPAQVPRDANVLLITIDTLRADHVGAYGYARPTTPALDALAAEGTLFENAFAHAPSTRYSVPAILTGRHPSEVAFVTAPWGWPALSTSNRTIAEILGDRGFTTGAILNYQYFDPVRGMDQGFDHYDNSNARLHQGKDPASTRGTSSREQANLAIQYLADNAGRRFFLWVHFYDPHFEFEKHPGTPEFGGDRVALYDHEIRFTDDQIARVIAKLKELGVYDRTIVAVTGDHGEGFGEHGIDFHGYHLYAAQTQVPLILRVPGLPPSRPTMPVGHVDLVPTLANLAGAPAEPTMVGRSLVDVAVGAADRDADREVFQEVIFEGPTDRRGVVTKRWHLLYNMVPDNTWELYDRVADPEEKRDVWGQHDVSALQRKLRAWIDATQLPADAAEKLKGAFLDARPSPAHETSVDFGHVKLIGWEATPDPAQRGGEVTLTLFFEVMKPLDGPWSIFVHGSGNFRADHDPIGGVYPMSRWRRGQFLADRHTVRINNRGTIELLVGFWHKKTGKRLKVRDGGGLPVSDDRVKIGAIRVQ